MKQNKFILGSIIGLILTIVLIWQLLAGSFFNKTVVQFFPIDQRVVFTDKGSNLNVFQRKDKYYIVGDVWSKSSEKVYLRQDVNLLFKDRKLVAANYPAKQGTDWLVDRIAVPLEKDSIYELISYHHAEIHQNGKDDLITSQQAVTTNKLYVVSIQEGFEAFNTPKNARQEEQVQEMDHHLYSEREKLLLEIVQELNINIDNYEVYNLLAFSEKNHSDVISDQHWNTVLAGLWVGLYKSYVLTNEISSSMPWVLVDRNATHLLVIFQNSKGQYEKLIQQI